MIKSLLLLLVFVYTLMAAVNINKADKKELMGLKGIGDKKATAIIKYRKKNGKFKSVKELTNVKGIGDKMVAKIKKDVTVK